MGIPQVPDQVKRAPTLALRAVFSGIGKILLAADRPQTDRPSSGPKHAASKRQPRFSPAAGGRTPRWRSLDETGNVRLLPAADQPDGDGTLSPGPEPGPAPAGGDRAEELTMTPVASQPLSGNVPVGASLVIHQLPLPGYDTMSLASIRARLRNLDVEQLQALLVHERKNAERPEVLTMLERRIEKLEQGGG
jgi:hypothetical protein